MPRAHVAWALPPRSLSKAACGSKSAVRTWCARSRARGAALVVGEAGQQLRLSVRLLIWARKRHVHAILALKQAS